MRTANDAREECNYIDRVAAKHGNVPEMAHSLDTFITYCEIQQMVAKRLGFHDTVQHIQHVLDDMRATRSPFVWIRRRAREFLAQHDLVAEHPIYARRLAVRYAAVDYLWTKNWQT